MTGQSVRADLQLMRVELMQSVANCEAQIVQIRERAQLAIPVVQAASVSLAQDSANVQQSVARVERDVAVATNQVKAGVEIWTMANVMNMAVSVAGFVHTIIHLAKLRKHIIESRLVIYKDPKDIVFEPNKDQTEKKESFTLPTREEGLKILNGLVVVCLAPFAIAGGVKMAGSLYKNVSSIFSAVSSVLMGYDAFSSWFKRDDLMQVADREELRGNVEMAQEVVQEALEERNGIGYSRDAPNFAPHPPSVSVVEEEEKIMRDIQIIPDPYEGLRKMWDHQEWRIKINELKEMSSNKPLIAFVCTVILMSACGFFYWKKQKNKEPDYKQILCKYEPGTCPYGTQCRYKHEVGLTTTEPDTEAKVGMLNTNRMEKVKSRRERGLGEKPKGAQRYASLFLDYDKNWAIPSDSEQARLLWFALRERMIGLGENIPRNAEFRGRLIDKMIDRGVLGEDEDGYFLVSESEDQRKEREMLTTLADEDKKLNRKYQFTDDKGYLNMSEVGKLKGKRGRKNMDEFLQIYRDEGEAKLREDARQAGIEAKFDQLAKDLADKKAADERVSQLEARLAALTVAQTQNPTSVGAIVAEQEAAFELVKSKKANKAEKQAARQLSQQATQRKDCFNWTRQGSCKWGDQCRFLHDSSKKLGAPQYGQVSVAQNEQKEFDRVAREMQPRNKTKLQMLEDQLKIIQVNIADLKKVEGKEALLQGKRSEPEVMRQYVGVLEWRHGDFYKFANWVHVRGRLVASNHAFEVEGLTIPGDVLVTVKIWRNKNAWNTVPLWEKIVFTVPARLMQKVFYDTTAHDAAEIRQMKSAKTANKAMPMEQAYLFAWDSMEKFDNGVFGVTSSPIVAVEKTSDCTKLVYTMSSDYGNSGGGVFNCFGQMVGIHNFRRAGQNGAIMLDEHLCNAINPVLPLNQ